MHADLLNEAAETLAAHPWIGEARPGPDGALHVTPAPSALAVRPEPGGLVTEYLEHWGEVYEWTYTRADVRHASDLDLSGWRASDTGLPLPVGHMREWIDHTVALVLGTRPRWILELGCGTGLLMYRLREHVRGYVGTDVASAAVTALRGDARPGTAFVRAAAHEATAPVVLEALREVGAADGRPDCVLINSVTQCFPGVGYLRAVVHDALDLVAPGGTVIVGDVRDSRLLNDYAHWVESAAGPDDLPRRAAQRAARDEELLFDPPLLARLARESGRTVRMSVHPKTMRDDTELTRYRFDAVLHVDATPPVTPEQVPWRSLDALGTLETPIHIHGIPASLTASRLREVAPTRAAVIADPVDPTSLAVVSPPEAAAVPVTEITGRGTVHDPFPSFVERRLREVARALLRRVLPDARIVVSVLDGPAERAAGAVPEADAARVPGFLARLDEAALAAMAVTLRPSGLTRPGVRCSAHEVAEALGVAERHRWILRRWLQALVENGLLSHDDGLYHGLRKVRREEAVEAGRGLEAEGQEIGYPEETTRFLLAATARLPELLRDEVPLQALLFDGDDTGAADGAYRENTVNRYLNAGVGEVLRRAAAERQRPLRVLEMGAGVGGTTVDALRALDGHEIDYLYTDVSRYFLSLGRERFADRPGVRFGLFDINQDPDLEPGSRDVLLSANVLHNARHVGKTIARLGGLLAPGGLFVFVETCREMPAILASMQFLMSPKAGGERLDPADRRAAEDRVFLTREEWSAELRAAGLRPLFTLPPDDHPLAAIGLHLFVARRE
ncbi:methyltransferase [Thermomonospora umbrina]|uniref:Ubiquinone/menaquinone biosynthesis C-methylase UbiE n=1 Tax=Thermomonospora umbrina TaxID=111806 RepID=A0A3D9SGM6_9ACTN|nr:methyltransferase [Thermomonospora umbrina]REE95068.1 ubiquinone/menaquinone biosynthesis C-methylase UbiE [Thermomonospora umbrina]